MASNKVKATPKSQRRQMVHVQFPKHVFNLHLPIIYCLYCVDTFLTETTSIILRILTATDITTLVNFTA